MPTILPRIVADQGGLRIVLPGDPGYDALLSADLPSGVPLTELSARAVAGGRHASS